MTEEHARRDLGSFRTKIFYGLGSVAYGVKDYGFGTLLLFYYNQVIGLPAFLVSAAIAAVLVFDAFADPIVGQISDNLRTRWGRRHPFMYASALPVAVSYFFLWNPPHWSHQALFFYLIVVSVVVRTFITMYEVPSSALVPELTDDYDKRTSFIAYRYFFGVAGAVAIGYITSRYLLTPDALHPKGQLNPAGYASFGLASAIIMVATILISAGGTHRYIRHFRVPPVRRIALLVTLKEMASSLSHPQFVFLMGAALFGTMAISLAAALLFYLNTYFWDLSARQIALFSLTGVFAGILGPIFAGPASRYMEKKWAAIWFFLASIIVSSTPIALRLTGLFPPNGSKLIVPILFAERSVSYVLGIACLVLFSSMMADVVDDNELRTGRRSEGLFFAASGFVAKMLSGAGTLMAGIMLTVVGFPDKPPHGAIDPAIVRNLALLYLPVLIGFYVAAMVALSFYRISREKHESNVRRLAESAAMSGDAPSVETAGAEKQIDYIAARAASGTGA